MCTAIFRKGISPLFGRTLDVEYERDEQIIVTPRSFSFKFLHEENASVHPSFVGIGCVIDGVPLYFDALNECGLAAAGLSFPEFTEYHPKRKHYHNVAPYEFIPFVLSECKTVKQVKKLLENTNVTSDAFSKAVPPSPLHWIIADKNGEAVTVESTASGLSVSENPLGILTNAPDFGYQMTNLCNYMSLSPVQPQNTLFKGVDLSPYSRGMGFLGLPGDFSSVSRFVRAAFLNSCVKGLSADADSEISAFFHVTDGVTVPYGSVENENGKMTYTLYTSCMDLKSLEYLYTTYENRSVIRFGIKDRPLDGKTLTCYPLK